MLGARAHCPARPSAPAKDTRVRFRLNSRDAVCILRAHTSQAYKPGLSGAQQRQWREELSPGSLRLGQRFGSVLVGWCVVGLNVDQQLFGCPAELVAQSPAPAWPGGGGLSCSVAAVANVIHCTGSAYAMDERKLPPLELAVPIALEPRPEPAGSPADNLA
jgi:hypothetical protein